VFGAEAGYPILGLFWTMFLLFGWVLWFWLLFVVYADVFRRGDIGGWAKTGWVVLTLLLPFIGVFIYLISQGKGMSERTYHDAASQKAATDEYIRSVAATAETDQQARARQLRDSGALTADEYDRMVGAGSH